MNDEWQCLAERITPHVQRWLKQPTAVALLHRFDDALNLRDRNGTIISIVPPDVGPGPFSVVVNTERPFPAILSPSTTIHKTADSLHIGPLHIDLRPAAVWQPAPDWGLWRERQDDWLRHLPTLQTAVRQQQDRLTSGAPLNFAPQFWLATAAVRAAIIQPNAPGLETAVAQLAGLGPGLTPAGDDFLLGLLLGLWATRPEVEVVQLAERVVKTAVPRTTQLSAAWLQAAARGEAWLAWHHLLNALLAGTYWQIPFYRILNNGATSGVASLLGFTIAASNQNRAL